MYVYTTLDRNIKTVWITYQRTSSAYILGQIGTMVGIFLTLEHRILNLVECVALLFLIFTDLASRLSAQHSTQIIGGGTHAHTNGQGSDQNNTTMDVERERALNSRRIFKPPKVIRVQVPVVGAQS